MNIQTNRQTYRQIEGQTDRQTDRHSDGQTYRQTDRQTYKQMDRHHIMYIKFVINFLLALAKASRQSSLVFVPAINIV